MEGSTPEDRGKKKKGFPELFFFRGFSLHSLSVFVCVPVFQFEQATQSGTRSRGGASQSDLLPPRRRLLPSPPASPSRYDGRIELNLLNLPLPDILAVTSLQSTVVCDCVCSRLRRKGFLTGRCPPSRGLCVCCPRQHKAGLLDRAGCLSGSQTLLLVYARAALEVAKQQSAHNRIALVCVCARVLSSCCCGALGWRQIAVSKTRMLCC